MVLILKEKTNKKTLENNKCCIGEDVEKQESLYINGGQVKWCRGYGKQSDIQIASKKVNIKLPQDPTILSLGIYPREHKHMS